MNDSARILVCRNNRARKFDGIVDRHLKDAGRNACFFSQPGHSKSKKRSLACRLNDDRASSCENCSRLARDHRDRNIHGVIAAVWQHIFVAYIDD